MVEPMASPYRADHVGSLLRPPDLLQARSDHAEGKIPDARLREVEEASILAALALQRQAGIDVFTDGEYRRASWSTAAAGAISGLVPVEGSPIRRIFDDWRGPNAEEANTAAARTRTLVAGEKLGKTRRFVAEDAAFLKRHAPGPWKITLPGPVSMAGAMFEPGVTDRVYPTRLDLARDLAGMLNHEITALIADGISYVQLDSLHYVERLADPTVRRRMAESGEDPDEYLDRLIELDNAALAGARGTPGVTVGIHMCRGNNRSRWHAEGSYEIVAEQAFGRLHADRFLLEYDTERAGGFEPLRHLPPDKMAVLGLVSSKVAALEPVDLLRRRLDEAARHVPLERLALTPQCGFASVQLGNLLSWDDQRRKLELVAETARLVWR
jgi:5-methyltetrahydropteroyltriglutamate--homocysteine methyltransferase